MATYYFAGPVRWAKVHTPDKKYGHYSLEIKLEDASLKAYQESGLIGRPSKDGEGYYSFRRKPDQLIWKDEERVAAGAPLVINGNGDTITDLIGNGSECTIKVEVYNFDNDYGKGTGHRLDAIRVDTLVPYGEKVVVGEDLATRLGVRF